MLDAILDLQGASGAFYRFRRRAEGAHHSAMAGCFAIVRRGERGLELICVGEKADLFGPHTEWPEWRAAQQGHGATDVYTRLNISEAVRREEVADIVERHAPPMNAG